MRRGARPSKATGKAKRPVAPKSEGSRVRDLEKHLAEAQEQQAATAEILRVISSSPADVQPVFDVIVRSAVRLCDGLFGSVFRFDGELMHLAAHYNYTPTAHHALLEMLPMQPRLDSPLTAARAILTRAVVQFEDVEDADTAREYAPHVARAAGFRSGLAVPMLREGNAVGAIFVAREQPGPFSAARIALLQTFADQAVIAIENVRLFTELQEKNRALTQAHAQVTESLEQQTATSEILRVISSSPTDVQPVFDAIVANAAQLCGAEFSAVMRFEGGLLHLVAVNNMSPAETAAYHTVYPRSPGRHFVVGRAFVEARPVHVADIEADPDYDPRTREIIGRAARYRTILGVPILRDGVPIGVIGCGRHEMKPFTAAQIELVQTFADQAVIAIENVRLFKELEARNRDLTATGEILQVISRSPTDAQPVFDTIARSAVRLCGGGICGVFRVEAERVGIAAIHGLA
jgi:two-component system, NtrC family, sensor kinase